MKKYQFTFYDTSGKYKPVSTIITPRDEHEKFSQLKERATAEVCAKRHWSKADLVNFGYTRYRWRFVDNK